MLSPWDTMSPKIEHIDIHILQDGNQWYPQHLEILGGKYSE